MNIHRPLSDTTSLFVASLARERFLSEASRAFSEATSLDAALERVADSAIASLAEGCAVLLLRDNSLEMAALRHQNRAIEEDLRTALMGARLRTDTVLVSELIATRKPLLMIRHLLLENTSPEFRPLIARAHVGPVLGVPICANEEILGLLFMGRGEQAEPFSDEDVAFATAIADRAALTIASLRDRDTLRAANEQLAAAASREQQAKEQALRQLEFTRTITGSLGEGVLALDLLGRITFANPAAEQMLGWTAADLLGKNTHQIIHLQPAAGSLHLEEACPVVDTLRSGHAHRVVEDVFTRKGGTTFPVSYTSSPIIGDGQVVGAVVAFHDITERKRVERQLQLRIEQLQQIYELTDVVSRATVLDEIYAAALGGLRRTLSADRAGVLLFDPDGVVRYKAWHRLSDEYRKATEGNSPWLQDARNPRPVLVPDVEKDPALDSLRSVILGEGIRALGHIPLLHQGQLLGRFVIYYDTPHHFSGDEVQLAQTISSHVAFGIARRKAEQALRESEEQYRSIVDTAQEGVWMLDADDRTTFVNERLAQMLGYTVEEMIGQPLYAFMDEDSQKIARQGMENRRRGLKGRADLRYRQKDGSDFWGIVSATPYFDADGHYLGALGMIADITERKRNEEERERQLAREQALARIGRAVVSEVELERVIDVVIEQSVNVLGADAINLYLADPDRRELTMLACRNLGPETVAVVSQLSYDSPFISSRTARTEEPQVVEDLLAIDAEPIVRKIVERERMRGLLSVPLRSRGRLVGVVTYLFRTSRRFSERDLEFNLTVADLFAVAIESAHLYDEVRQALRLREEFMAAAAHELKTPVTTIKGWAELLLRTDSVPPRERKALETIHRQSDRIRRLIDDLLAVIRLRPGLPGGNLRRERFDLNTVVHETVDQIARTTDHHQFRYQANGPLIVEADRPLIGEVLSHLLENAMRYAPAGGPIDVEARREDNDAVVSVHDFGVGIPYERQPHVFEPFFEVVPSGIPGYAGIVSLGLHLSKQIVDAHGGRIWFASVPSQGATFSFSLPLA